MAKKWREIKNDGDNVVARFINSSDLKGLTSKDLVIGPNEAAVIIEGGKIEDIVTQTKQKNFGNNILERAKNTIFGSNDSRVLFVDTSPIEVTGKVKNISTKDNVKQTGTCELRFQINLDEAQKVLNLIKSKNKLTTTDLRNKIKNEITSSVFSPLINQYKASEFKGSTEVQESVEQSAMMEMRKSFDMWGLNLINVSTRWDKSKVEKVAEKERARELEEREKDIEHRSKKRDVEREYDMESTEQKKEQDLDWGEVEYNRKKERTRVDHEERNKTMRTKGNAKRIDIMRDEDKKDIDMALDAKERLNELNMEKDKHENELEIKKFQGTKLEGKKIDADVEKTKAQMEAEKKKHELETHKEAEDRERDHQARMTEKSAELMQASKQDVPDTLVQGTDRTSTSVKAESSSQKNEECPSCGTSVEENWQHCPECGEDL